MLRFFTSLESVAFLPLPNLATLVVISCCAFKIAIEPKPKWAVLHRKRAGQEVFTVNLSTSSVSTPGIASIIAVNAVARAFNQLCSLCKTKGITCPDQNYREVSGSAGAHFNPYSSLELNAGQRSSGGAKRKLARLAFKKLSHSEPLRHSPNLS